jgi:hypothetical protein
MSEKNQKNEEKKVEVINDSSKEKDIEKSNISFKDILTALAFFGSTESILYLFGLSISVNIPVLKFISIQDYINISISQFIPILIFSIINSFFMIFVLPVYLNFRMKSTMKLTKKDIAECIFMIFVSWIFAILLDGWFKFDLNINGNSIYNSLKTNKQNSDILMLWFPYIKFWLYFLGFFLFWIFSFKWIDRNFISKANLSLGKIVLIFLLPLYLGVAILIGYSDGIKDINNHKDEKSKWIFNTKDNSIFRGSLILSLEKYVIINEDSLGIFIIRSDNMKSMSIEKIHKKVIEVNKLDSNNKK